MSIRLHCLGLLSVLALVAPLLMAAESIVPNGGFEQDSGGGTPAEWTPVPAAELGKCLKWTKEGRNDSAAITIRDTMEGRPAQWTATVGNIVLGKQYEVSVWVSVEAEKPNPPSAMPQIKVVQLNAEGRMIARPGPGSVMKYSQTILSAKGDKPGWQELSAKFTTDDDVKTLLLICQTGRDFKGLVRFDDFRIIPLADTRPENDYYIKVDTSVATPHTPWARPLAGGKLKAFCLVNNPGKRELVELWQRLDMDFEAVVAISPSALGYAKMNSQWKGNSEPEKVAELGAKLKTEYDVYIVGNVAWDSLPVEMRNEILRRVSKGKGLVFVFEQKQQTEDLKTMRGSLDSSGAQWILSDLPLSRMRMGMIQTHAGFVPAAKPVSAFVRACLSKDGRVVFLDYPFPEAERYTRFAGKEGIYHGAALCPFIPFDAEQMHEYEYSLQLLARSILWASKREAGSNLVLDQSTFTAGDNPVAVRIENPPKGSLRLWYRLLTAKGQVLAEGTQNVGGVKTELNLGFIPAVDAQLELRLLDAQALIHTFATYALNVEGPVRITNINVERAKVNDGVLKGAVALSAPSTGKLRLRALDIYDRLVLDQTFAANGRNVAFEFPLPKMATSRLHDLRAELLDDAGRAVAINKTPVCVPQPEKQDVTYLAWASAYFGGMPMTIVNRYCKERFGMDLYDYEILHAAKVAGKNRFAAGVHPGTLASLTFNQATVPWNIQVTYSGSALERKPCLSDEAYRKSVHDLLQTSVRYYREHGVRPPFYSLGDEFNLAYPGSADVCFAAPTQARFRIWLEKKYGSLDKLNEVWGTTFTAWDKVSPITMEDAQAQNQPARWLDHRLHMDDVVVDFIDMCRKAVLELDPDAKIGFESLFRSYSECGYDLERITDKCEFLMSYEYPYRWEMFASFMPAGGVYGLWNNSHTTVDASKYHVGKSIAHGLNVFGWWRMTGEGGVVGFDLGPGGRPTKTPGMVTQAAQVAEARKGPARLLFGAPRIDQSVAILHSQTSLHMGKLDTGQASAVSADWSAWQYIIEDLGIGYRYIKSAEIDKVTVENTRVLILPFAVSLPDQIANSVKRYVESGGTVITDVRAGARDGFGRPVTAGPLSDIFGITHSGPGTLEAHRSPLGKLELETNVTLTKSATSMGTVDGIPYGIVHLYGRGRAVTLNFLPAAYVPSFAASDFAIMQYKPEFVINAAVAEFVLKLLKPAGVGPSVGIGAPGQNVSGFEQFVRAKDQTRLVTIIRKFFGDSYISQPAEQAVYFGDKAHVYDVRQRKYLGFVNQTRITLNPGEGAVLALLPYQPRFADLKITWAGGALAISGRLDAGGAENVHHVLRVEVTDAAGKRRIEEDRNLTLDKPAIDFRIPLPLNAAKGRWTVRVMDVGSDQEVEVPVVVE